MLWVEPCLNFECERNIDRIKLTAWVCLVGNGSDIFQRNVAGDNYLLMINEQLLPVLGKNRLFGPETANFIVYGGCKTV